MSFVLALQGAFAVDDVARVQAAAERFGLRASIREIVVSGGDAQALAAFAQVMDDIKSQSREPGRPLIDVFGELDDADRDAKKDPNST